MLRQASDFYLPTFLGKALPLVYTFHFKGWNEVPPGGFFAAQTHAAADNLAQATQQPFDMSPARWYKNFIRGFIRVEDPAPTNLPSMAHQFSSFLQKNQHLHISPETTSTNMFLPPSLSTRVRH